MENEIVHRALDHRYSKTGRKKENERKKNKAFALS